ncbi:MAG: hypothetical protein AAGI01_17320 [Myxococcota bacterium]
MRDARLISWWDLGAPSQVPIGVRAMRSLERLPDHRWEDLVAHEQRGCTALKGEPYGAANRVTNAPRPKRRAAPCLAGWGMVDLRVVRGEESVAKGESPGGALSKREYGSALRLGVRAPCVAHVKPSAAGASMWVIKGAKRPARSSS